MLANLSEPLGKSNQKKHQIQVPSAVDHKRFSLYHSVMPKRSVIRIEADSFTHYGCEMVLYKGDVVVARSSDRGFVVRDDLVCESDSVDQLAPAAVTEFKVRSVPLRFAIPGRCGYPVGVRWLPF